MAGVVYNELYKIIVLENRRFYCDKILAVLHSLVHVSYNLVYVQTPIIVHKLPFYGGTTGVNRSIVFNPIRFGLKENRAS